MTEATASPLNVVEQEATILAINLIKPLPWGNIRKSRSPIAYAELLESVKRNGVYQPIVVRPTPQEHYEIVAGYGRLQATSEAGYDTIPVLIKPLTDAEARAIQLDENLNREDLSPSDQIASCQAYLTHFNGDRAAAASAMGWSVTKLAERLELTKLTENCIEALDKGEISAAHGKYLAPLPAALQDKVLTQIKAEKWPVAELKKRVGKAKRPLSLAKFECGQGSKCDGCPHNTTDLMDLFGGGDNEAECSNLGCFIERTNEWLAKRKAELASEYGTVLLVSECGEDAAPISAKTVGMKQFKEGCTGCESNCIQLSDRIGTEGTLTENICLDVTCRSKHEAAVASRAKAKTAPQEATNSASTTETDGTGTSDPTQTASKGGSPAPITQRIPKAVTEDQDALLRHASANLMIKDKPFQLAVMLAGMMRLSGYKPAGVDAIGPVCSIPELIALHIEELQKHIVAAQMHFAEQTDDSAVQSLMHTLLPTQTDALKAVKALWLPTSDRLKMYTKGGLKQLLVEAGFDKSYEDKHKDGFGKLMNKGKPEIIETVVAFTDHDWSDFAPEALANRCQ